MPITAALFWGVGVPSGGGHAPDTCRRLIVGDVAAATMYAYYTFRFGYMRTREYTVVQMNMASAIPLAICFVPYVYI